jgi:predicted nucleotidyltransferase/plasmid maintenance system antidote protein VapI
METAGEIIRRLRKEKELPLRKLATCIDIDQAILSKIERGQRKATREQIIKLSSCLGIERDDLLVAWLADKLVYEVGNEEHALKALKAAEELITYKKSKTGFDRHQIIKKLRESLINDGRVKSAWIYGSFSRGTDKPDSDLDLMIEMKEGDFSMFDLLSISHTLEQQIQRKVDMIEKGTMKDFAMKTADKDMIKIYG